MVTAGHKSFTAGRERLQPASKPGRVSAADILQHARDAGRADAGLSSQDLNALAEHLNATLSEIFGKDERIVDLFAETSDACFLTGYYNHAIQELLTRQVVNDKGENAFAAPPQVLTLPTSWDEVKTLLHPKSISLLVAEKVKASALVTAEKKPTIQGLLGEYEEAIASAIENFMQLHSKRLSGSMESSAGR